MRYKYYLNLLIYDIIFSVKQNTGGMALTNLTYIEAENYVHSLTRFGSQLGLERMNKLLELMGNPHKKLKFVHIAGTNGKGSTAQMSTNILRDAGYNVGTYTSPFVVCFRERFQVNGEMISEADFVTLTEYMLPFIKNMSEMGLEVTEFEMITAIAFEYFCKKNCDIVCLEVGLGGKYDATNVIYTPIVAIITSISLDHVEILGDTIEKIAGEKAGIIKQNSSVVTYPLQQDDAVAVFMQQCAKTGSTLIIPNANQITINTCNSFGSEFIYDNEMYKIKLVGEHQIYNAVAVIEAMNILSKKGFLINTNNIKQGLEKTIIPARFEIMSTNPLVIVDGAHNSQAARSLAINMDKLEANYKIAIMGMMADKDYESAVNDIGSRCKSVITVPVNNPRAINNKTLATIALKYCDEVYAIDDYLDALEKAMSLSDEKSAIIICGSFYMASDMRKIVKNWKSTHKATKFSPQTLYN